MKKSDVRKYYRFIEIGFIVIGILLLVILDDPYMYSGLALFAAALAVHFFLLAYKPVDDSERQRLKSRTRDQLLKHQYRAK